MCGIIGIVLDNNSANINPGTAVFHGLIRLEYRGYDSAGVASVSRDKLIILKGKGRISELEKKLCFSCIEGDVVIGHTRWATHGAPSDINAHPHSDCSGRIAVVHNGVIQNYRELKKILIQKGHVFKSETDTEVIPHLVEEFYRETNDVFKAFVKTIKMLEGSFAIALITVVEPDKIFFAKKDSPLIIGIGNGFNIIASDIPALLEYTRRIITLRDNWIGYITPNEIHIIDLTNNENVEWSEYVRIVEWSLEDATRSGYPHYMLKEIHEQPRVLKETYYGIREDPVIAETVDRMINSRNIYITGAGTSYHACLYFSILMNIIGRRPVISFVSSEYQVYVKAVDEQDLLIVVSQSGETMDSLKALRSFKERGVRTIAISNVVDSAIPRECELTIYTRAGPEIGVAATKTFTTQTLTLTWLAIAYSESTGSITRIEADEYRKILGSSSELVAKTISWNEISCKELAKWLSERRDMYYLSRSIGLPIAMEGALKMKEIAYIHAEAYPAGESKHGPIALVEEDYPVLFIIPEHEELEKILLGNIQEMKARNAVVIGVASENTGLSDQFNYWFKIPSSHWLLTPITHTPVLQLLAYYTAVEKGFDPDKPRNLAKTVTVE
ncbi:MAG: glutamine--fructose-6-phosphate transaminase (isomerizing) [Desulfurococcaceae archaeon]